MMASTLTYFPDGQDDFLPVYPRTWSDGPQGEWLRAKWLTHDAGGAVLWHRQRPIFQGVRTTSQSIPNAAFTPITGLEELIDNYGGHSDSSNTGRWYAPYTQTADWYLCLGYIPYSSNSSNSIHIAGLRLNGGGTVQEGARIPGGAGHVNTPMVLDLVQMAGSPADYLELVAYQNSGAAVNTSSSANKAPSLTVRWVCMDPTSPNAFTPALPNPRTWLDSDRVTADATGTVGGHVLVPLNRELRDLVRFLNNPPICRVTAVGTTQTIPSGSGTWTSINFMSAGESVDNYSGWSSSNPSRYTCQRAGLYLIAGFVAMQESSSNSGYRAVRLLHTASGGGSTVYPGWAVLPPDLGQGTSIYAVNMIRMAVGDYVEVQAQQTEGAAVSLWNGAGNSSRLVAVWMAA